MIPFLLCCLTLGLLAAFLKRQRTLLAANIGEGVHEHGVLNKRADAAIATRHLIVKSGTDVDHIAAVTAASDRPLGICPDQPAAAEDPVAVKVLGVCKGTLKMVASGVIAAFVDVYMDAAGKISALPTVAGTYYRVGSSLNAAAADLDLVEVQHCVPERLVVIAALTNVNSAIGTLAIGAAYSQAEVTALRDATETLADDVRALQAALTAAKLITIAA